MKDVVKFGLLVAYAAVAFVSCGEVATATSNYVENEGNCPLVKGYSLFIDKDVLTREVQILVANLDDEVEGVPKIERPLDDLVEISVYSLDGCEVAHYTVIGVES